MIMEFRGKYPKIDPTAFIAENAMVIGEVEIGPESNIWFYSIVRGDLNYIRIGSNVNIQDSCVLHIDKKFYPLVIEDEVVLGHRVVAHGCTIRRGSLIGIGTILLNGAEIGEESIVGAGSVVTPNTIIPPRTLALGAPAKPVRSLNDKDLEMIKDTLQDYQDLKKIYQSFSSHKDS
ncbi:MAG: gamma carbonic anhydrase family protein [Thermodesulfobacteriota bacterium]|nr:gamma carbonic anhydrase family protein [Thermodesulfobacteriota bacterium]